MRRERNNEVIAFLLVRCPHNPLEPMAHVAGRAIMRMLLAELFAQPDVSGVGHGAVNGV